MNKNIVLLIISALLIQGLNAQVIFEKNYKYGLKDESGKVILKPKYDYIYAFNEGFAVVKLGDKWGYINASGKEVVPLIYDHANKFSDSYASVLLNEKWGLIDTLGKVVVTPKYKNPIEINGFEKYIKVETGVLYGATYVGLLDRNFNEVLAPKYSSITFFDEYGFFKVSLGNSEKKFGLLDEQFKLIIPVNYDNIFPVSKNIIFVLEKKWSILNNKGNHVGSYEYEEVYPFSFGFANVKRNEKFGYINETGTEIIPCKYEEAEYFQKVNDVIKAKVKFQGKEYYIDANGMEIKK